MDQHQLVMLMETIIGLCYEMAEHTKSITTLVESNQRIMMILAEGMVDEEQVDSITYLDGSAK